MGSLATSAAYDDLIRRSRERSVLGSCAALLGWDEQTYMPKLGSENRGNQLALLAGLLHDRATDPAIAGLLDDAEGSASPDEAGTPAAANVRELRRSYDRQTKLPRSLVEELARATSKAHHDWVEARKTKSFPTLRPALETVFALKRQEAACLDPGGDPYDPLLDEYEPGAKSVDLANVFAALRADLVPLVAAIGASGTRPDVTILRREFPVDRQRVFAEAAAAAFGFDFDRGRLDTTEHPFCTGIGPGDTRITTRFDPRNFSDAFFGVLHEVGHGLYDQGLDPAHHGTPMGEAVSLGVHESQSRLWENLVGRSRPFWAYWFPLAKQVFREALGGVSPEAFYAAVNEVKPSLIRVQADEVTYNLHVMIRFELERALLSGDLPVADLPAAWNAKYTSDLGVTPLDDSEGCMQDIHWSAGLVGYFPTYTLGNIYSAQLFDKASRDLGDLPSALARGDYAGLLAWLREHVHAHGQHYSATELMRRASGAAADHAPLVRTLRSKYGELYGL